MKRVLNTPTTDRMTQIRRVNRTKGAEYDNALLKDGMKKKPLLITLIVEFLHVRRFTIKYFLLVHS